MNNLYLFTAVAVCALGAVFFVKRVGSNKKNATNTYKHDSAAQTLYDQKKNNTKDVQTLTMEQRLELSWQFLYEITEFVLNKFTEEDKQEVHKLGEHLAQANMRYQHIVELSLKPKHSIATQSETELNR